jgi:hypothetical protein
MSVPDAGIDTTLTPLKALHAETSGNHQQRIRLRQADCATSGNLWKRGSADCGSEGCGCSEEDRGLLLMVTYSGTTSE